jgi:DNA-binding NarL/FixJ family response regulator
VKPPRVMLADDHPMVAEAFRKLLEDRREIVGTVTDGHALLQAAPKLQPDVQILHHKVKVQDAGRTLRA